MDQFEESVELELPTPRRPEVIAKIIPRVEIFKATSIETTALKVEHVASDRGENGEEPDEAKRRPELKNIDICIPPKEKIAQLIPTGSIRSEVLLSIVNNAKFKELERNREIPRVQLSDSGYESLDPQRSLCSDGDEKNECLSLMDELLLADNSDRRWTGNFYAKQTTCSAFNMDSGFEEEEGLFGTSLLEESGSSENGGKRNTSVGQLEGCLGDLKFKTEDMRNELYAVRRDFYEEDLRISRLMKETKSLRREIEIDKCLDEYFNLLSGTPEKINSTSWPFRVCMKDPEEGEVNLIV